MHRVDTATAAVSLPAPQAVGSPGWFTQGDPGLGIPATVPGPDFFNMAQEELANVVLGAGITLDASKLNFSQLFHAIQRIVARAQGGLSNASFVSSVAANALTNALKGINGLDPSPANPVSVSFRSTTLTDTAPVVRSIEAAMSIVAPQGATFGFTANETGYLYKYLVDDGATLQMGLTKKAIFDESRLHDTVAIGAGSDSDNVLYTTSAVTNAAVRLIGRELIQTGATPGDWSNASTRRDVWAPAMAKTIGLLASASGAHATSYSSAFANFVSPVNVEPGDLVHCTYTVEALRNGAEFASLMSMGVFSGTATLDDTGILNHPGRRTMIFHGASIFGGGYIYKSETHVARIATAGTIVSYGPVITANYGTAATSQKSHIAAQIYRPNL